MANANAAPVANTNAAANANANAAQNNAVAIADQQVPLAVNGQEDDQTQDDIQTIEDDNVPLASGGTAKDGIRNWWWWIAAGVAAITGKGVYDNQRRKPAKNKSDDSSENDK